MILVFGFLRIISEKILGSWKGSDVSFMLDTGLRSNAEVEQNPIGVMMTTLAIQPIMIVQPTATCVFFPQCLFFYKLKDRLIYSLVWKFQGFHIKYNYWIWWKAPNFGGWKICWNQYWFAMNIQASGIFSSLPWILLKSIGFWILFPECVSSQNWWNQRDSIIIRFSEIYGLGFCSWRRRGWKSTSCVSLLMCFQFLSFKCVSSEI